MYVAFINTVYCSFSLSLLIILSFQLLEMVQHWEVLEWGSGFSKGSPSKPW